MHIKNILPQERHLISLARTADFPASRDELIRIAERRGFSKSTLMFLTLFAADDISQNGIDFINQCEELKLMIREARHAPLELLRNPQD